MKKTDAELKANYEKFIAIVKKYITGDRLDKVLFMYSDDESLRKFYQDESIVASQIFGEANNYSNIMPLIQKHDKNAKRILDYRDLLVLITKE